MCALKSTLVSQKTGNEIMNFAYTAGGAPYGFTYNGANYFYLLNLQGDVIGIYDSNGDVVVKYAYDAWGQLMSITGTLADTIGVKNPLRYRGYYYDTETKLYYLQSRYYDPETCHFISMDSYFVAGDYINGMNMYAYCVNNPVNMVDCSGYCHGYANNPDLSSPYSGVRYGYNCGSYGVHVRNPREEKTDVSAGTVVGISSDVAGMVGTGLEVAAANSNKLTNVGGGFWEMQTTMPKVAAAGKGIGAVTTGISAVMTGTEVYDIWANRDDLSTSQKAAGTVIEIGGFGASVGVGALASKAGTAAAAASFSHPLLAAGAVILGITVVGGVVIYTTANYFAEKVGI